MWPKKINILYFIGAGASASIAPTKVPCMNDFFAKAIQKFDPYGTLPIEYWLAFATIEEADCFPPNSALKKLASKIRNTKGSDNAAIEEYKRIFLRDPKRLNANLEEVFSSLVKRIDRFKNRDAYGRSLFLLSRFFYDLDRELDADFERAGHHSLAEMISASDHDHTFVSFNFDIWLERAFSKKGIWHPRDGYGCKLFEYYLPPLGNTMPIGGAGTAGLYELLKFSGTETKSKTIILKPHGSFSWMAGKNRADESIEALLVENAQKECHISYNKDGVFDIYRIADPRSGIDMIFSTLIVPPIPDKERKQTIFSYIDTDIEASLRRADMIVVIGWSMPDTDQYIREIVSQALQQRKNQISKLIVCDVKLSSSDHVQRLKSLFRPSEAPIVSEKGFGPEFVEEVLQKHAG